MNTEDFKNFKKLFELKEYNPPKSSKAGPEVVDDKSKAIFGDTGDKRHPFAKWNKEHPVGTGFSENE